MKDIDTLTISEVLDELVKDGTNAYDDRKETIKIVASMTGVDISTANNWVDVMFGR